MLTQLLWAFVLVQTAGSPAGLTERIVGERASACPS